MPSPASGFKPGTAAISNPCSPATDDVEFRSPLAAKLLGDPSGTILGKANLREYFAKALAAYPGDLGLELVGVYDGVDSVVVLFQARGRSGAEVMEMNRQGVVRRALAHSLR